MKSPQQVDAFINEHEAFPFSRRIRAPYLDNLYKQKDWKTITEFQKSFQVVSVISVFLRCSVKTRQTSCCV